MQPASFSMRHMLEYVLAFSPSLTCAECKGVLAGDSSEVPDNCSGCGAPTDMAEYRHHWRSYVNTTVRAEFEDENYINAELAWCAFRKLDTDKTFASSALALVPELEKAQANLEVARANSKATQKVVDDLAEKKARETEVKCSKCGSRQIAPLKKGYGFGKGVIGAVVAGPVGLLAGALGSGKLILHCLGCGHKWEAGKP